MARGTFAVFGALAFALSVPANAAEVIEPQKVVQYDSLLIDHGFLLFDTSLGTLETVSLAVQPNFFRNFQIILPGQVDDASVLWSTNSQNCSICSTFSSSGSADVALTYEEGFGSYGYFGVTFTGPYGPEQALSLSNFVNPATESYERRFLTYNFPGLYDQSFTGIFSTTSPNAVFKNVTGGCEGVGACDHSVFRLTYTYAPGGVPEPATWFMMFIGFGAVGARLRARRRLTSSYA